MIKNTLGSLQEKPNKDSVYAQPRGYDFTYYLSDCVQDSHEYHELLQLLDTSSESDNIRIVINNVGGEVGTTTQIVDHIRNSKALVTGHISGNAFSAAGIIWLACHQQTVAEHSMLMIHGTVGGCGGKYSDMTTYITAANKRARCLYEDIFEHFLKDDELESIFKGEEMWLVYEEIISRLDTRQKLYEIESSSKQKESEAQLEEALNQEFPQPYDDDLKKLTKPQLIKLLIGEADLDENGKFVEVSS